MLTCVLFLCELQVTEGHDVLELMEQMGSSSGATRYVLLVIRSVWAGLLFDADIACVLFSLQRACRD